VLTVCWSPKGGSGTSVVAAALAVQIATGGQECLLVDLAGDQPSILGLPSTDGQGLTDWLAASDDVPFDALRSLELPVAERLRILPRGRAGSDACSSERLDLAAALFATSAASVVIDAGSGISVERWWPASAVTVTTVRACYLALRRLAAEKVSAGDRIVLVEEAGRALTRGDVRAAVGEVAVHLPWDPAVARAVDAGLLAHRMPRSLHRLRVLVPATTAGRAT
jgi:Cellulose biosynthesis protein BcsQ